MQGGSGLIYVQAERRYWLRICKEEEQCVGGSCINEEIIDQVQALVQG